MNRRKSTWKNIVKFCWYNTFHITSCIDFLHVCVQRHTRRSLSLSVASSDKKVVLITEHIFWSLKITRYLTHTWLGVFHPSTWRRKQIEKVCNPKANCLLPYTHNSTMPYRHSVIANFPQFFSNFVFAFSTIRKNNFRRYSWTVADFYLAFGKSLCT
jgi:hypothetical protein